MSEQAKQISWMNCPYCKSRMSTITWRDLKPCGIRLRITPRAKVNWETYADEGSDVSNLQ